MAVEELGSDVDLRIWIVYFGAQVSGVLSDERSASLGWH